MYKPRAGADESGPALEPVHRLTYTRGNPPCGGTSPNSPRAGRQQGSVGSAGYAGGLFVSGDVRVGPTSTRLPTVGAAD